MTRVNEYVEAGMLEMFPTDERKKEGTKTKFPKAMKKENKSPFAKVVKKDVQAMIVTEASEFEVKVETDVSL